MHWQVTDDAGRALAGGRIACDIAENGIAEVGAVAWQIPERAAVRYTIRLRLEAADQPVSANEYLVTVRPRA